MSTHKRIFIAGGKGVRNDLLKTCEVYNIDTDEWHFVASLTLCIPSRWYLLLTKMRMLTKMLVMLIIYNKTPQTHTYLESI